MKKKAFLFCLLIVCSFTLFVSCKNESVPEEQAKGEDQDSDGLSEKKEWEEIRIAFTNEAKNSGILQLAENEKPVFISKEITGNETKKLVYQVFEWSDDSWRAIQPLWIKALQNQEFNSLPTDPAKEQDGNYHYSVTEYSGEKFDAEYSLYRINENQQTEKLNTKTKMFFQGAGRDRENFWKYHVLDDQSILFEYTEKIIRFDLNTGRKLMEKAHMDTSSGELLGDWYYSMNESADRILVTDVKTGQKLEEINYKVPSDTGNGIQIKFCKDEEENLYIVTTDGIFRKDKDSAELIRIVPFEKCSIYDSTDKKDVLIKDMSCKDGILYVSYYSFSKKEEQFYQYRVSAGVQR